METTRKGEVTRLLDAWSAGDRDAFADLLPKIYDELRQLAAAYLRRERADHTLQTTALVHEAYLRLIDQRQVRWHNRVHFFGIAAQAMRRVLVDHARQHLAEKRGSGQRPLALDEALTLSSERAPEVLALHEALKALHGIDPRQARIVELRFFAGLTSAEIGTVLDISVPTVTRAWRMARAWLFRYLETGPADVV